MPKYKNVKTYPFCSEKYFLSDNVNGEIFMCGGDNERARRCNKLTDNGWSVTGSYTQYRAYHNSWVSPGGLLLLGGGATAGRKTAEVMGAGKIAFNLKRETM